MILTFLGFNQDISCVALGTNKGLLIYNIEPIERRFADVSEGVGLIEMLYCTSLLAYVGSGDTIGSSPRRLKLCKSPEKEIICELPFNSAIVSIKMNKLRLIVCLDLTVHIFDLTSIVCLQVLSTTVNINGVIALSSEEKSYLAFPSGVVSGDVIIYDTISLKILSQFHAHKTEITNIEFNRSGTLLATASKTGTVIRVFATPAGEHMYSFRRGSYPAHIHSINFCPLSQYLCVASSSGTVHIFAFEQKAAATAAVALSAVSRGIETTPSTSSSSSSSSSPPSTTNTPSPPPPRNSLSNSITTTLSNSVTTASRTFWSYIPTGIPMTAFAENSRAVATLTVSCADRGVAYKTALLLSETAGRHRLKLAVVTMEGHLYRYIVSLEGDSGVSSSKVETGGATYGVCMLEDEELLVEE